jgi:YD repeat-containing protein
MRIPTIRFVLRTGLAAIAVFSPLLTAAPAGASETISYGYDARGRLVQVARTGTVNNGVTTSYTLDKADNRTNKTTSGSGNPPPP